MKSWTKEELIARSEWQGNCLIWKGGYSSNGAPYVFHEGVRVPTRRLMLQLSGIDVPAGHLVGRIGRCRNPGCICEAHAAVRNHKEHLTRAARSQVITLTNLANRRIAARKRAKLTPEQAEAIRNTPGTVIELGKKYGVSMQTVSRIKRGVMWAAASNNPFAGLM